MKRGFFILFLFLAGIALRAASPLAVELKAFAVEAVPGSEPTLTAVEVVKPGQLIEYRAVFTNISDKAINGVVPEIPVPTGMTIVLESIDPEQYALSANGTIFVKGPLLDASGKPLGAEYVRSVRWAPANLEAGSSITTRLRARVNE